MSHRVVEEQLQSLVSAGARLLRVESHGPHVWVLHFDRSAVEVSVAGGGLELAVATALPELEAESLDEEDPWWTVIGEPLAGAWSVTDTEGRRAALELQLRRDDQKPKRITLEPHGPRLQARAL